MVGVYRSNALIEVVATAVSLEILDRLAKKWGHSPPFDHWRRYAVEFEKYRINEESTALDITNLKESWSNQRWDLISASIRKDLKIIEISKMGIESKHGRAVQTVAAMLLRRELVNWKSFVRLEDCTDHAISDPKIFLYAHASPACICLQSPILTWLN